MACFHDFRQVSATGVYLQTRMQCVQSHVVRSAAAPRKGLRALIKRSMSLHKRQLSWLAMETLSFLPQLSTARLTLGYCGVGFHVLVPQRTGWGMLVRVIWSFSGCLFYIQCACAGLFPCVGPRAYWCTDKDVQWQAMGV